MGAVRAEQGRRRSSLLVSPAQSVEVMIRRALAIYHLLPSQQAGILPPLQHSSTAGVEGTDPVSGRKPYMMQKGEAFNEL